MTALVQVVIAVIGLVVSARTRYHGVPVLWLLAAVAVLGLAVAVLVLVRAIVRDGGLRLQPRMVAL